MLSIRDQFGEFSPLDAAMPVQRGECVDVIIDCMTVLGRDALVASGVIAWCEPSTGPPTCDLIDFGTGLRGVATTMTDLTNAGLGHGLVALVAPHGIGVWIRLLTAGQCEDGG